MLNHEVTGGVHGAKPAMQMVIAIVQRGKADTPIRAALKAGAQGAVTFFGRGQGIRERLGLLGLAVQAEKEIVVFVVPAKLTQSGVRAMVPAGNPDQPGVGFLFVMPVEEGVGLGEPISAPAATGTQAGEGGEAGGPSRRSET